MSDNRKTEAAPTDRRLEPFHQEMEHGMGLPDFPDLSRSLHFSPHGGRIWLDDQRMVLTHVSAMATLRRELMETVGADVTRGLLTRSGYAAGVKDADFAARIRPDGDAYDLLSAGPALHALEGVVSVEPIKLDIDVGRGHYYGEFFWRDSAEVDAHLTHYEPSTDPVCWSQIGYACGYTSQFMGKQILYKEVECRGMGHRHCRIVGKPVEDWEDPEPDVNFLSAEPRASYHEVKTVSAPAVADDFAGHAPVQRTLGELVGASSGFVTVCHLLEKVASTNATALFLGETGVGKERFAKALHAYSRRSDKPFVAVNCAAIPEALVESELFGVARGAYTGATASRPGRFERADGGTLFLDEIGDLNLNAQGKLLRVLQEGELERVGDSQTRTVDVRVIAATNVNLEDNVAKGLFRDDLWFRLNVFPINIPPLRERRDDIPLLMDFFLRKYSQQHDRRVTGFTQRAISALLQYAFPGNIRELENMVERGVILANDNSALDIPQLFTKGEEFEKAVLGLSRQGRLRTESDIATEDDAGLDALVDGFIAAGVNPEAARDRMILRAVERADGNVSRAARELGMTRTQVAYRHDKLKGGLSRRSEG